LEVAPAGVQKEPAGQGDSMMRPLDASMVHREPRGQYTPEGAGEGEAPLEGAEVRVAADEDVAPREGAAVRVAAGEVEAPLEGVAAGVARGVALGCAVREATPLGEGAAVLEEKKVLQGT
jgi:hypothetical protein